MPINWAAASFGMQGLGMGLDLFGGSKAKKEEAKRFREFQNDLMRREQQSKTLEAIARGELQASLADSRLLFGDTLRALSASGSAGSRRILETVAHREAEASQRMRQRGMQGSTVAAEADAIAEREVYEGTLDAEGRRNQAMAGVMGQQAAFESQAGMQIADSYRREAAIGDQAGREMRSALENTQVGFTPVSGAIGTMMAELRAYFGEGDSKPTGSGAADTYNVPETMTAGLNSSGDPLKHPSVRGPQPQNFGYHNQYYPGFSPTLGAGLYQRLY